MNITVILTQLGTRNTVNVKVQSSGYILQCFTNIVYQEMSSILWKPIFADQIDLSPSL